MIGDQVTLTAQRTSGDEDTSALKQHSYTITAIMQDAADLIADDGVASFRSSQSAKYFFYVTSDALDNEVYSAIELSVRGAKNLSCFSEEYQDKVDAVKKQIEKEIREKREQARYDEVVSEAAATLADARLEADTQFADADAKITDARAELDDGKIRLADGWQQLQDGIRQLNEQKKSAAEQFRQGYVKISDGYTQLASGEQQLTSGKAELKEHQVQLNQGAATLQQQKTAVMQELSNAEIQLTQGQQQASDGKEQILAQISQIQTQMGDAWPQDSWKSYETAVENGSTYNSEKNTFQTDLKTRIEVLNAALDTQILQLDPNAADYDMQKQVLEERKTQLLQIPDGISTLETQYESLQTTLFQLETQKAAIQTKKQEAIQQFTDAETELNIQQQQLSGAAAQLEQQEQKLTSARQERGQVWQS